MAITYFNYKIKNRKKQPLLHKGRVKYRSHRSSEKENLETNLISMDITRILSQIDAVDVRILENLKLLIGDKKDVTTEVMLNDGLKYDVDGVQVYIDNDSPQLEDLSLDTMDLLSSRLARVRNKIQRLEKE